MKVNILSETKRCLSSQTSLPDKYENRNLKARFNLILSINCKQFLGAFKRIEDGDKTIARGQEKELDKIRR